MSNITVVRQYPCSSCGTELVLAVPAGTRVGTPALEAFAMAHLGVADDRHHASCLVRKRGLKTGANYAKIRVWQRRAYD